MKRLLITTLFALAGAASVSQPAFAGAREEAKLIEASGVLEELQAQRDTLIPDRLLARAYGVAVIPNVIKVAAVVGGRRGTGALVASAASAPAMTLSAIAASLTVRAKGPIWSSDEANASSPYRDTRP